MGDWACLSLVNMTSSGPDLKLVVQTGKMMYRLNSMIGVCVDMLRLPSYACSTQESFLCSKYCQPVSFISLYKNEHYLKRYCRNYFFFIA